MLAQIRVVVHLRDAVDRYIAELIEYGGEKAPRLLDEILGEVSPRPTWKEIGQALDR